MRIRLAELMDHADGAVPVNGLGRDEGRQTYERLLRVVDAHPGASVFEISLDGIGFVDASFAREAVVSLMKRFRGEHGFCLADAPSDDVLDNFEAAALRLNQPVIVNRCPGSTVIGPRPPEGLRPMLQHVLVRGVTSSSEASAALRLQISNASNKLKALWRDGYVLRREVVAPSGGIVHEYLCPASPDRVYSAQ